MFHSPSTSLPHSHPLTYCRLASTLPWKQAPSQGRPVMWSDQPIQVRAGNPLKPLSIVTAALLPPACNWWFIEVSRQLALTHHRTHDILLFQMWQLSGDVNHPCFKRRTITSLSICISGLFAGILAVSYFLVLIFPH